MLRTSILLAGLLAGLAAAMPAQDPKPVPAKPKVDLQKLKARMKSRFSKLSALRDSGTIGETADGKVAVRKDADAAKPLDPKNKEKGTVGGLVKVENADRAMLYAYLAKQLKTSASKVAAQNGLRNLNRAKPTHWFRLKNGTWAQRKSIVRKKPDTRKPKK